MWIQFLLQNTHFALNLFAGLVFFLSCWLHYDAWLQRKTKHEGLKVLGFLILAISFVIHAVFVESKIVQSSIFDTNLNNTLFSVTRILGYLLLTVGLILDPLQKKPQTEEISYQGFSFPAHFPIAAFPLVAFPILSFITFLLYTRKAFIGLENHLKGVSASFFILSLSELLSLAELLKHSQRVDIYHLVAPFGLVWILQHTILLIAVVILGRWVYYYLLSRLQSQLFMIFTVSILTIFLLTTVTFTGLLVQNLQDETSRRLETDVKVLQFAVDSKKAANLSDTQVLAQNPQIAKTLSDEEKTELSKIVENFLLTKKENFLVIVDGEGKVLARGEDPQRVGDSLSDDPLIKRALLGEEVTSVISLDGALAPEVSIRSAVPVKKDKEVIGVVMTGTVLDNAFVDGVKSATGLETAIYGDNILSATTQTSYDGKSRHIGIREENSLIKESVLQKGESFKGQVSILNTPYLTAYLPLKDMDGNPAGMLFVGIPQVTILQTASRSIELTFIVSAALLVLSIIPSYLISKYLAFQLR